MPAGAKTPSKDSRPNSSRTTVLAPSVNTVTRQMKSARPPRLLSVLTATTSAATSVVPTVDHVARHSARIGTGKEIAFAIGV